MEFKRRDEWSQLFKGVNTDRLITKEEVKLALTNEYLHDQHSHFIVSGKGEYDDTRSFIYGLPLDRIKHLSDAYNSGKTIVVKEMENWNENIIRQCQLYPRYTDVHMYVSPVGATGFGWHTDDKDVFVHMQIGQKTFEVEEPDGTVSSHALEAGDVLFIPYGARHRAFAGACSSVHLGFGVWPDKVAIRDEYFNFPTDELKIEL